MSFGNEPVKIYSPPKQDFVVPEKECAICYDSHPLENFFNLAKCPEHRYCLSCINAHIINSLN